MGFFEPDDPSEILRARIAILRLPEDTVTDPVGTIVQRALFSDASRRDSIGKSGEHVTLDDVRSFAARSLAPNGAVLVLVGDFESAPTLERIQTYFGPISPATAPRATLLAPAQLEEELQLSMTTRAKVPEVRMDWRTPPLFAAGDAELDVFARAMVGTRDALLRSTLVEKMRVATRVTARQISHASGSDFRITAVVAPGHTLDEVKVALDETLRFIREQGLSDGAFASARANVTVPYVHDLDRPGRRATAYATLAMMHRDPRRLAGDVGRYDAVTSSGVNATMARWLTKEHRLVSAIVPTASATDGGPPATRGAK
jgi:zinc protease